MSVFLFIGHDQAPHSMALRDSMRKEHRAYVLANDSMIRSAGAIYDPQGNQCGTLIAFEAAEVAQVREWVEQEPFHRSGVYARTEIVEWRLAFNRFDRMDWAPSQPVHGN